MSLFWEPSDAATIVEMPLDIITTGTQDMGNGVYLLRAGTPLDEYFAVANDEDAVYLVAEDFIFYSNTANQAKVVPLITAGYVDLGKAEAAAGITYTDDCLAALEAAGITLVNGMLPSSGGGGGGALMVHMSELGVLDKTWREIDDAALVGPVILLTVAEESGQRVVEHSQLVGTIAMSEQGYGVVFGSPEAAPIMTDSADGYPDVNFDPDLGEPSN